MTKPKFKIPTRFDDKIADDGVWFEIETESGESYGSFLCALIDNSNPRTLKANERLKLRQKRMKNTPGYKERADADALVELSLLDWKLKDVDGKLIPYDPETAVDYLTAAPFVLNRLLENAIDVTNYTTPEDIAGK